ncbi:MAG TPA: APC family permease [Acidimicrobiia bacterium]|nr:APC family permease [Acidimicrobiia bacterium]
MPPSGNLRRELGVGGAVLLGLGSIVGTGIFVGTGIAAEVAGPSLVLAIGLAGLLATLNGLSSAQLAASHPTSGGTYEYGYEYLTPALGFTAGWMFLAAKSASAATAALGFAGYLERLTGIGGGGVMVALAAIVAITALVSLGIRRSSIANAAIVSVTLLGLLWFALAGSFEIDAARFTPFLGGGVAGLLEATALMFVAYTGYGRIATLGEEVHHPAKTIPRAIIVTLVATVALYLAVTATGIGAAGADGLADATGGTAAPLEAVARGFPGGDATARAVSVAAVTALLAVLLNLVLGLSRVVLAMGRRGDLPRAVARVDESGTTPFVAVPLVGLIIAGLAAFGSVKTTWTFSAFTVLVYYALTNLAAIRLPSGARRYPVALAWMGLAGCLGLAFWVDVAAWAAGLGVIAVGLAWHAIAARVRSNDNPAS